jgi:Zn-dependent metalloprotease
MSTSRRWRVAHLIALCPVAAPAPRRLAAAVLAVAAVAATGVATPAATAGEIPASLASDPVGSNGRAAAAAAALVANRPADLYPGSDDTYLQLRVVESLGWHYVPYERRYRGLPVIGGDFVVVVDPTGRVSSTSVAQRYPVEGLAITPTVSLATARTAAKGRLRSVANVEGGRLVVYALGAAARLAWESTLEGVGEEGPSRLTVHVDALTGEVLDSRDQVQADNGYGAYNGPSPFFIDSTASDVNPGVFLLKDPFTRGLSCADGISRGMFASLDRSWGNGYLASRETQCVDAMFAARKQVQMLAQWLGRNGPDGAGGAWPMYVGIQADNAHYYGDRIEFGYDTTHNRPFTSLDIVGHEMGHGIDHTTPGGSSRKGTSEFIADVFGVATEWYANEPAPYDTPDYTLGEQQKMTYAIRYMHNPGQSLGDTCYHSGIEDDGYSAHTAAGIGDHWFYLVAEGTNPTNGQLASPTCNFTTMTGIGIVKALQILYHAMLMKTSNSSYRAYRSWTLTAANNLFPGDCAAYNAVRSAWGAVGVPTQPGEPTCLRPGPWVATGRNADGRLDLYGNYGSAPTFIRWQTAPHSSVWSAWRAFGGATPAVKDLGVLSNFDGRLELFGVNASNGHVTHRWQDGTGSWSDWVTFDQETAPGTPPPTRLVSVAAARGEVYAIDGPTGVVYRRVQTGIGGPAQTVWSLWHSFGSTPRNVNQAPANIPPPINSIAAGTNSTGRIELFATTVAGEVLHRQQQPSYNWGPWTYLSDRHWETNHANQITSIAVARNVDGRLDLYGLNGTQVQLRWETTPGGPWTNWTSFGPSPAGIVDLDAIPNADGRITLFGVTGTGHLHQRTQGSPNGNWLPWTAFGRVGTAAVPDVRGKTVTQARQTLQASGFAIQVSYFVDHTCDYIGTVKTQTPTAGTAAVVGATVRVSVGTVRFPDDDCL